MDATRGDSCILHVQAGVRGAISTPEICGRTIMTDTKWLRRALLGGVALTVAGTAGARADELADLKTQLEALQSRVNTLEQQPAQASNLPPGASFVTFERGSRMDFVQQDKASDRVNQNDDAGFTIAITPSADMPAPVAEIVVYGYVKGDVIYDVTGSRFGGD